VDFDDFAFPAPEPAPPEPQRAQAPFEAAPLPPLPSPGSGPLAVPRRSPTASRARAGLGVLAAAAGAGLGGVLGGPWGVAAGLTGVGAARNLYRAQGIASVDPDERASAAKSIALAVVGFAIAGYLGYKACKESE